MAADLQLTITSLAAKIKRLGEMNVRLAQENESAKSRIRDLEYDNRKMQETIEQLHQQLEHLTVVNTLQATEGDKARSRAILAGLIREIDQCINDLTD